MSQTKCTNTLKLRQQQQQQTHDTQLLTEISGSGQSSSLQAIVIKKHLS